MNAFDGYPPMFPPCTEGPGVGFHFYSKGDPERCLYCGNQRIVLPGFNQAPHFEAVQADLTDIRDMAKLVAGGSKIVRTPSERETLAREWMPAFIRSGDPFTFYAVKVKLALAWADEFIKQRDIKS